MVNLSNLNEASEIVLKILNNSDSDGRLKNREGATLEFKQSFSKLSLVEYAKTMAAFANNCGGIIVFGVMDSPRIPDGIEKTKFEEFDPKNLEIVLNKFFAPKVEWDMGSVELNKRHFGFIWVYEAQERPVICTRNNDQSKIREGIIYYRYSAQDYSVKYAELAKILRAVRGKERRDFLQQVQKIVMAGPSNTAVLNLRTGVVGGNRGTFIIDRSLLPKIAFIKKGSFKQAGKPVLKLIGNVVSVNTFEIKPTNNPEAPEVQLTDAQFKKLYPLIYENLTNLLKKRYVSFKTDPLFHKLKNELRLKPEYANERFLDPDNPTGGRWFYSQRIVKEFDKYYKKRPDGFVHRNKAK